MAVYTEVPDSEIEKFLTRYRIGQMTAFTGIAEGVENTNFFLSTTTGSYILTLYEKRVDEKDLPFFLGLMDHLATKGLSCPRVIADRDGATLGRLCGRAAAITSFLDGTWPRQIKTVHCHQLGGLMAQFHDAAADFTQTRTNNLSLSGWGSLLDSCRDRGNSFEDGLIEKLDQELDFLTKNWPQGLPAGVIHADLFQDNVFFIGDKLSGVIDFYFACNDLLAYELAICLNAWCFEDNSDFNCSKSNAMLTTYHAHRPLTVAERDALPILARGAALRFLLTRLFDWLHHPADAFVEPKNPLDYISRLTFHQKVKSAKDYGL